jgi:hypothetical protein
LTSPSALLQPPEYHAQSTLAADSSSPMLPEVSGGNFAAVGEEKG